MTQTPSTQTPSTQTPSNAAQNSSNNAAQAHTHPKSSSAAGAPPLIIAGLGNHEGAERAFGRALHLSRHNAGARLVLALAELWEPSGTWTQGTGGQYLPAQLGHRPVILALPGRTDLNHSGADLLLDFPEARVVAVYDDLDLAPGTLRWKTSGGSGGHRGMADILKHYPAPARLRVGIGRPLAAPEPDPSQGEAAQQTDKGARVLEYVLADLSPEERAAEITLVGEAAQTLARGIAEWMRQRP